MMKNNNYKNNKKLMNKMKMTKKTINTINESIIYNFLFYLL